MNRAVMLDKYIHRNESLPFDWGSANCCHFAGGWLAEAERRPELELPGSKTGALRFIAGHGTLQAAITDKLKRTPIPVPSARLGDILLFPGELVGAVGICNGLRAVVRSECGLNFINAADAVCAWAVGGLE